MLPQQAAHERAVQEEKRRRAHEATGVHLCAREELHAARTRARRAPRAARRGAARKRSHEVAAAARQPPAMRLDSEHTHSLRRQMVPMSASCFVDRTGTLFILLFL